MMAEALGSPEAEAMLVVKRRVHYTQFGGAPLLGVDGTVVICHGRSDRRAIFSAVRACARSIDHNVNADIVEGLSRAGAESGA